MAELVFDLNYIQIATATPELFDTEMFGSKRCALSAWLCVPLGGCQVAEHEFFEAPFIEALAKYWPEVIACLSAEDLPVFADQVDRIKLASRGNPVAAHAALAELMFFLRGRLPPRHPVGQAMPDDPEPVVIPADLSGLAGVLAGLSLPADPDPPGWLLSVPALTDRQVRELGVRPERADLIRLSSANQHVLLPAFQFAPDGQPVPVVEAINKLLDAESDPWGVTDWWLGENAWLGGVPAELIGKVADADLMRAAAAAIPPDDRREE
jgi:hypothetical protein